MKQALMISLDRNLFLKKETDSYTRQVEYAKKLRSLTILVYTKEEFKEIKEKNLRIIPVKSNSLVSGFFAYRKAIRKLKEEGNKFDVVTSQDPFILGLLGHYASKLFKADFRAQLHIEAFSNPYWRSESLLNRVQYCIGHYVIRKTQKIRVVSRRSETWMKRKGIKAEFIPVATNLEHFKKSNKKRKNYDIIGVGRLVPQKNFHLFIEIIEELKKDFPELKVALLGSGYQEEKLKEEAKKRNLEETIEFVGSVEHERLKEYLFSSKVFLLTSNYEGWGLVCIEASMAGLPVVMSNTGCAGEIIVNNKSGFVCEIGAKEEFRIKLTQYLKSEELRRKHSAEARRLCEKRLEQKALQKKWVSFLND